MLRHIIFAIVLLGHANSGTVISQKSEHVILLHGLCRSASSMNPIAQHLHEQGYIVHNIDYDSRSAKIPELSEKTLSQAFLETQSAIKVHIITHSMGGILVRDYLSRSRPDNLGKVVMLAPPNNGSEVVDKIGHWWAFQAVNGPAGLQLGTGETDFIASLPLPDYPTGIITGTRSFNWINSCMIPGPDDGKVSTKSAQLPQAETRIIPATHTFIMNKKRTKDLVSHFLSAGTFPDEH